MIADAGNLVVGLAFALLVVSICVFWIIEQWAAIDRRVAIESLKDAIADAITFARTWSVRKTALHLGMACISIGQRLMEWAQQPETPSSGKLVVKISREWERRDVVVSRTADVIRVSFGARRVKVRV